MTLDIVLPSLAFCLGAMLGLVLVFPLRGIVRARGKAYVWGLSCVVAFIFGLGTSGLYLIVGAPVEAQKIAEFDLEAAREKQRAIRSDAIKVLKAAKAELNAAPESPEALFRLAISSAQLGNFDAAIAAARQLVALDPEVPDGLILLAGLLIEAEGGVIGSEAQTLIEQVLHSDPNHARALYLSGEIAWQNQNTVEAFRFWQQSFVQGSPEWQDFLRGRMMAAAAERGDDPEKLEALTKALDALAETTTPSAPDRPQNALPNAADIDEMVAGLAARLAADPSDVEGWRRLVQSYTVLGETEKLEAALQDGLAAHPDNVPLMVLQARWLRAQAGAETDEIIAINRRIVALDPNNIEALWFLAVAVSNEPEAFEGAVSRLLSVTPEGDPRRPELERLVNELRAQLQE